MQGNQNQAMYMFRQVRDFGKLHENMFKSYPDIAHDFDEFNQLLSRNEEIMQHFRRNHDLNDVDSFELGEQMVEKAIMVSSAICVWAIKDEQPEIQERVDQLRTDLFKTQDSDIVIPCAHILTEAQAINNKLSNYSFNKLELKQLDICIQAFEAFANKSTTDGKSLNDMMSATSEWLVQHLDESMRSIAKLCPGIYKNFVLMRESVRLPKNVNAA